MSLTENRFNQEMNSASQLQFIGSAANLIEQKKESGECEPVSIVNFNPVALKLSGLFEQYCVPSPMDTRLPADVSRVKCKFDKREHVGHVLTITEPKIYGRNSGGFRSQTNNEPVLEREPKIALPVQIGYSFLENFSPIYVMGPDNVVANRPREMGAAAQMHGVMAFKGTIRTLERLLHELAQGGNPKIEVPFAKPTKVGKLATIGQFEQRSYRWVECYLDAYMVKMFEGQLKYADSRIARANRLFHGDEVDRKNITDVDRDWRRWAIALGYAKETEDGKKDWLYSMMSLSREDGPAEVNENLRNCKFCKAKEPAENTLICPNCHNPIDVFTSYMAGADVPDSLLMTLRGEERQIVLEERALRRAGFEDAPAAAKPKSKPASEPAAS